MDEADQDVADEVTEEVDFTLSDTSHNSQNLPNCDVSQILR